MTETQFDVFIVGGGQAGIPLAWALAGPERRVALAERERLGGSCVNFGCTPTKAAVASARVAHLARRGVEFGLKIPTIEVDFPAVLARARRVAAESRIGLDQGLEPSQNPQLIRGHACLEGRDSAGFHLRVGEQVFTAAQVVLNSGTRSFIPPIPGMESVPVIHAGNWLYQTDLPEHLAMIGGGYIGLEMAQFYRRMGSRVTILEVGQRIIPHEDEDITQAMQAHLEGEGIVFRLGVKIERIESARGVTVHLREKDAPVELHASHLFVATGRTPNTDDLGLETVGVTLSERGNVIVNERLATNVEGIWAAGDIRGGPLFTHTAWDDYRVLMSQLTGDGSRTTHRIVPYAVFTDPELGCVGMTETEARRTGNEIKVAKFEMKRNGKASELGEEEGFIKVIADAKTGKMLGAALFCTDAAELVHTIIDLMNADVAYTVMRDAIHIHPTLAEAVQSAVTALD